LAEFKNPGLVSQLPLMLCGKRFLIVDDNATSRKILLQHIRGWGIEGEAVTSGREALKLT
jgi:CheY-like chemotaxis protein